MQRISKAYNITKDSEPVLRMSASINLTIHDMNPRGRPVTRTLRNVRHEVTVDPISCCGSISTASTYSIPRSHSPASRTSRYVNGMYSMRLQTILNRAGEEEYPGVRCTVRSLPYASTRLGLSGLYCGEMDVVSKLPDGEGILYCNDGKILEGEWCLGRLRPMDPTRARRCSDSSADTCDSSACSSLSASITRHHFPIGDEETNTKLIVPKNLYIIKSGPSNMIPCENGEVKVTRRESTTNESDDHGILTSVTSTENNRAVDRTKFTFKPSFVSKVKRTFNRHVV